MYVTHLSLYNLNVSWCVSFNFFFYISIFIWFLGILFSCFEHKNNNSNHSWHEIYHNKKEPNRISLIQIHMGQDFNTQLIDVKCTSTFVKCELMLLIRRRQIKRIIYSFFIHLNIYHVNQSIQFNVQHSPDWTVLCDGFAPN